MSRPKKCVKHTFYDFDQRTLVKDMEEAEIAYAKRMKREYHPLTDEQRAQMRCCSEPCSFQSCDNHNGHEDTHLTVNTVSCRFCGETRYIKPFLQPFLLMAQIVLFLPHILFHILGGGIGALPRPFRYPFIPLIWLGYKVFNPIYNCGR